MGKYVYVKRRIQRNQRIEKKNPQICENLPQLCPQKTPVNQSQKKRSCRGLRCWRATFTHIIT